MENKQDMKPSKKETELGNKLLTEQSYLRARRSEYENIWRDVANHIFPAMNKFDKTTETYRRKHQSIVYSRPLYALTKFATAYNSMNTPQDQRWHSISLDEKSNEEIAGVKEWKVDFVDTLFKYRYAPKANFVSQNHERYLMAGMFGIGVMSVNPHPEGGIAYKSEHIAEHYFKIDHAGVINEDYHMFNLDGFQAIQRYGEEGLPEKTAERCRKNPNDSFGFLHVVRPNPNYVKGSKKPTEKKFQSVHIDCDTKRAFKVSGMNAFPYAVTRYITVAGETYAISPAMIVLPDIKTANSATRASMAARALRGLPPVLTRSDGIISTAGNGKIEAGKVIKGGLDINGNALVKPYISGADPSSSDNQVDRSDAIVNEAFLVNLFQSLVDTPRMTATEVLHRMEEKGNLLTPLMGREQSETLSVMIERETEILAEQGLLPPPPEGLVQNDEGIEYSVKYSSPLSKAQLAQKATGILRTVETAVGFAQIDPTITERLDLVKALKLIDESNLGLDTLLISEDDYNEKKEQKQQEQVLQQALAQGGLEV